jgi:hypothetical protein
MKPDAACRFSRRPEFPFVSSFPEIIGTAPKTMPSGSERSSKPISPLPEESETGIEASAALN